jgi:hypothetical protein
LNRSTSATFCRWIKISGTRVPAIEGSSESESRGSAPSASAQKPG